MNNGNNRFSESYVTVLNDTDIHWGDVKMAFGKDEADVNRIVADWLTQGQGNIAITNTADNAIWLKKFHPNNFMKHSPGFVSFVATHKGV